MVPAGSYATPTDSAGGAGQAASKDDDDDDDDDSGAVPAGKGRAAQEGWTIGSMSHGSSVGLVVGLGAAAVGGTVAGVALSGESPSPSN